MKTMLPFLVICLFGAFCRPESDEKVISTEKDPVYLERDTFHLLSQDGDTLPARQAGIPAGESIPVVGKLIYPDSVAMPKVAPLKGRPKVVPAYNNVHPVGTPKVVQVPDKLRVITPGKDNVPLPETVPAKGILVPAIHSKPSPSQPFRMRDAAIFDIQYLDVDQGMNSSYILFILEDSRENLWFSTGSGVSRYDGAGFTHFTSEHGLKSSYVSSILEDSRGNLWFATYGGVIRYDGAGFTHFTPESGLKYNYVESIEEDSRGNLWFAIRDNGVSRYNPDANGGQGSFTHFTTEHGLSNNRVYFIEQDSRGNLWFATMGGGMCRYTPDTNGGQGSFTQFTTEHGLSSNYIWSIREDSRENLWIGTFGSGVIRYEPDTSGVRGSFTHFTTENGLNNNYVRSIEEDSRGNLWFGTEGSGVTRYDPNTNGGRGSFTHFTTEHESSIKFVISIEEDSEGNLWFGTYGDGVTRYDPNANSGRGSFTHFTTEHGLSHIVVCSILEDNRENLWFGTYRGVDRYDPDAHNGRGSFTHFATEHGLNNNYVYFIAEDSQGNLWFGTSSGVSRYAPDAKGGRGSFTHFTTEHGLSYNGVSSIVEDKQKNLWMTTPKGITLLIPPTGESTSTDDSQSDDYQFFTFGKEDGLKRFDGNVGCLDRNNRIWWGAQHGLTMLDLNQFELPTEPPRISLEHVEIKDEFLDFRRLSDSIYRTGLLFDKDLSHSFDSVVPFYNYPLNLALPFRLNHLTFYFSAIDWTAPHKIKYSYKLDDDNWSAPKSENKADYRNIPYGRHTFIVKAVGVAQVESEPFEYTFIIHPPWWLTWWAYIFYGLIIASLLYILYRFLLNRQLQLAETRRLRELDEVKTRLYTNITHEFRTPLTIISGMADQVLKNPKEWLGEGLQMIKRNSRKLLDLVNQMLDLRKLEAGSLPVRMIQNDIIPYLRYLTESFHSYADSKSIELGFASTWQELIMDYDPEKINAIASNLLSNALKFTPDGGSVQLTVNSMDRALGEKPATPCLELIVKDTGIGIPPEKLPSIFERFYQVDDATTRQGEGTGIGLALTRELVKLMSGQIEVESKVGAGTEFRVWLPISRVAPLATDMEDRLVKEEVRAPVTAPETGLRKNDFFTSPDGQSPTALIVEDNRDVVRYLISCLEGDYQLEVAYDGQEGIDMALEIVPDIIISDVMMPKKDGFALCQTLKTDLRTSHIPIVLLTAKADMDSKISGLQQGADAYLAKPFNETELQVRLAKLLELRLRLREKYGSENYLADGNSGQTSDENNLEEIFLHRLKKVIESHLDNCELDVSTLCIEMGISRTPLHHKLKALTGKTTTEFIRHIRLNKACELLLTTDLNVSEVAYRTGFQNHNYFTRMFRELYVISPSEYRDVNRK